MKTYVENGGILIVEGALMQYDQYGIKLEDPLISGIEISKADDGETSIVEGYDINVTPSTYLNVDETWNTVAQVDDYTVLAYKPQGKGYIVAIAGEMQDYARAELLKEILIESGAKKSAQILHTDRDEEVPNVEVIKAKSEGMTGWYLSNMNVYPRLIRLRSEDLINTCSINPLEKEKYSVSPEGEVTLLIPSAKRFVLVTGPEDIVTNRFGTIPDKNVNTLRAEYQEELRKTMSSNEFYRPSTPANISDFANAGFDNQQQYKVDTAFIEDGKRELKDLPFHKSIFGDLMFDVIRFDFNENKTCIALRSKYTPGAPESVEDIPLNGRLASVAFLLAGTHVKDGEKSLTLRFHYQDGSKEETVLSSGYDFGSWLTENNTNEMNKKAVWNNNNGNSLFLYEWYNPEAAKPLKSLDLISGNGETSPVVCAITTRNSLYNKEYQNRIELSKVFSRVEKENMQWHDGMLTSPTGFSWIFANENDSTGIDVSKINLENAVVRLSISRLQDKYGNIIPLHSFGMGFRGIIDGQKVTCHPSTWTKTHEGISPTIANKRNSLAWYEIEWPVKNMLKAKESSKEMQYLKSLMFSTQPGDCPLNIRFLRIEYND